MAKGLRASSKKSNRSKLRARVFGPVEDARTERLHAKLLEVVQQQKPEQPAKKEMDIDSADEDSKDAGKEDDFPKEMEVDNGSASVSTTRTSSSRAPKRKINKSKLKKFVKPRNQMSFPKRNKGVAKPASGERVRRRRLP